MSHLNELCEPEYEEADFYDLASAKGATRSWSDEVDFGARWRDSDSRGNTYRLSWLRATGELVVVRAADRKITLLGVVADEDELKRVLSGWSDICGTVRSFGWLRSRVAATDWSRAWVPVGARRACAGFKIRPFPAGHRIYIDSGAPDVYGDIASITISLNELGPFISRARETLENIEREPSAGFGDVAADQFVYAPDRCQIKITDGDLVDCLRCEPWELAALVSSLAALSTEIDEVLDSAPIEMAEGSPNA